MVEEKNCVFLVELVKLNGKIVKFCSRVVLYNNNFRFVKGM